jgi:hypothetical protein
LALEACTLANKVEAAEYGLVACKLTREVATHDVVAKWVRNVKALV